MYALNIPHNCPEAAWTAGIPCSSAGTSLQHTISINEDLGPAKPCHWTTFYFDNPRLGSSKAAKEPSWPACVSRYMHSARQPTRIIRYHGKLGKPIHQRCTFKCQHYSKSDILRDMVLFSRSWDLPQALLWLLLSHPFFKREDQSATSIPQ